MRSLKIPLLILFFSVAPFQCTRALAQAEGRETEAIGKLKDAQKILEAEFPPGSRHEALMVPMRDGVKLATDIFIPPGPGPWPVLFARGYYGRLAGATYANRAEAKRGGLAFVCQDARGVYDSEGKEQSHILKADFDVNDCSDTLDWIAKQNWCNGKIGTTGASGNGVGPAVAFLAKNPHLLATVSDISSAYPYYYWGFENGVRRGLYQWLRNTGLEVKEWPKPTLPRYDVPKWQEILAAAGQDNPATLVMSSGWYDINTEGPLDFYSAFAQTSKVFLTMRPKAHAGNPKFPWPEKGMGITGLPKLRAMLEGQAAPAKSQLKYFLRGNFRDPASIGNVYKTTNVWPMPNTPTSYYLHGDGTLSQEKSAKADDAAKFDYDPRNPAPTLGGNHEYTANAGPYDQRPLADRKDILHFVGAPLESPLEITGKLRAELYISTDVPDTLFVVKVVDIHPDGYQMILRESAVMGRYAEEFEGKPAPLQKGKVYHLKMELGSTAILMDKGHRLAVLVTSSSSAAYEVHPNSFEPVMSYEKSPIAHQVVHLSAQYPSKVILPIITGEPQTLPKP